jgi:glycosyltransferase involved in cell wall biosynthesis
MDAGGAERVAATLANAWAARGDRVTLMPTFSGRGDCFYKLSPDVRLVFLADLVSGWRQPNVNRLIRLRALRRFIRADRPSVIVAFLSNVNVAAVFASAGLGIPVIACERIDPFVMPTPVTLRLACRCAYPFADALMVQTSAVAAKYAASLSWPLRRLAVIPNPLHPQAVAVKRAVRIGERRRLLSVGRLHEQKQFDVLIDTFAGVASRHTEWSLRIVGEGPLRTVLQDQVVRLGLADRIVVAGRTADIADEFAAADAFALASQYEGFPNALMEAMAAGLPCITFDCPSGPRELALDGQAALLVPANDRAALGEALERIMSDADLRAELGERGRASVLSRFSLSKVLATWDSLFNDVGVSA